MSTLLRATVENVLMSPFEEVGLLVCWAIAIWIGLAVWRRCPTDWRIIWPVWFVVCTGLTFTLLIDGMLIEEHTIRFHSGDNPIAMFIGSTIINLLVVVTWPIFVGFGLIGVPSSLGLLLEPVATGAAASTVLTVGIFDVRGRAVERRSASDQA